VAAAADQADAISKFFGVLGMKSIPALRADGVIDQLKLASGEPEHARIDFPRRRAM
jgi:hypothetical protein